MIFWKTASHASYRTNLVIFQSWVFYLKSSFPGVYSNECFISDLYFNKQEDQMSVVYGSGDQLFQSPLSWYIWQMELKLKKNKSCLVTEVGLEWAPWLLVQDTLNNTLHFQASDSGICSKLNGMEIEKLVSLVLSEFIAANATQYNKWKS